MQEAIVGLLGANPVLLLFATAALGISVGRLRLGGFGLGVSAVLFAGMAIGALDPRLSLPEFVVLFGLVLFVYTIGLTSGPSFFRALRGRGSASSLVVLALLLAAAGLGVLLAHLGLPRERVAGLFAGATTNTPALAAIIETLDASRAGHAALSAPVVGYSIAYPFGVLGALLTIGLGRRLFGPGAREEGSESQRLESATVQIERDLPELPAGTLARSLELSVCFGRLRRGGELHVVTNDVVLLRGDLVTIIGSAEAVAAAVARLGSRSAERIDLDRSAVDYRRVFVSSRDVVERPLAELDLGRRFGAVITRLRRGDSEFVPDEATMLAPGDRVRVVAPRERIDEVSTFLGDSYRALAEVDVVTFGVGIALGLLLGQVPIPAPGGGHFALGYAGGPLIAGLVLGKLGRTGRLVWTLPYSANLTLRQTGTVLFLAGIGLRSGGAFAGTLAQGGALALFLLGVALTSIVCLGTLWIGRHLLRLPAGVLLGVVAGVQTQPADLAFAIEQTKSEEASIGYASVYPVAMIAKILLAQAILQW